MKKSFALIMLSLLLLLTPLLFSPPAQAQSDFFKKHDSLAVGDTISTVSPGGIYTKGAFTLRSTVIGDTIKPQARYGTSSEWVTTSVKNIRTQSSDTNIIITASSWPVDYEINDPVIVAFRLVSKGATYITTRKTYVDYRFRRRE